MSSDWEFNDVGDPANAVDSVNGYSGEVLGGALYTADAGGRSGTAGDYGMDFGIDSTGQTVRVPDLSFLNGPALFDEVTISFWQKLDNIASTSSFWAVSPSSAAESRGLQAHVPWDTRTIYFDYGGATAPGTRVSQAVPIDWDEAEWHHYTFVKWGNVAEIWIDGVKLVDSAGAGRLATDFTELYLGSAPNGTQSVLGMMDDFAMFSRALTPEQIGLLAGGASAIDLVTPPTVVVTEISVNPVNGRASMTWTSRPGKSYSVFTSTDLTGDPKTEWTELTDGVPSGGETTSFIDALSGGGPVRFYVVIEN